MIKMNPPKLAPPGTNFLINKDPQNLFCCKIWTPAERFGPPHTNEKTYTSNIFHLQNLDHLTQMKNVDPEHISLTKF